jgi:hypothetical protein
MLDVQWRETAASIVDYLDEFIIFNADKLV